MNKQTKMDSHIEYRFRLGKSFSDGTYFSIEAVGHAWGADSTVAHMLDLLETANKRVED